MTPRKFAPRWFLLILPLLTVVAIAQVGSQVKPLAASMTDAANRWLALLSDEEKKTVCYAFDDKERFGWFFVPLQDKDKNPTRKGLRLEKMNQAQKDAAFDLVKTALSEAGFRKVQTIISLESLLAEQEKGRGPVRNPGWYFLTIFGTPSLTSAWGWRIDGHHLSLNITIDNGRVVSVTPAFFGSNPGEVKTGPRQGTRPLASTLDNAIALVASLSADQQKLAKQKEAFPEVQGGTLAAKVTNPPGIRFGDLQPPQQAAMQQLLNAYLENFAGELQSSERARMQMAGLDQIHFAYSGTMEPGTPVTYRLQGPNLLVEFLNVQGDAAGNKNNHYHSSWRALPSDFGKAAR